MMRSMTISALLILCGACIAPNKPSKSADRARNLSGQEEAVAMEVSGEELTVEQVRKRQRVLNTALPSNTLDRELAVIADFELLADEAEKQGYGRDPRVVNAVKDALAEEARKQKLEVAEPRADVDEAAVQKAFKAGRKTK